MSRGAQRRKNYHAISRGRCPPCITTSWSFTNTHVSGLPDNRFQGFATFPAAKKWLLSQISERTFHFIMGPADGPKSLASESDGYDAIYAVANGRETGVYSSYSDVQALVKGYSGATFKSHAICEAAYASLEFHAEVQRSHSGRYLGEDREIEGIRADLSRTEEMCLE
ncbi:unnamed protein product [Discula destructiva]